jgi:hypothetical protein
VLDPARAINRSILLLKQEYSPVYPLFGSNSILFDLHYLGLGCAHFIYNPLGLAPTLRFTQATSLAPSLFFFLATLNQLGYRLKQLAALKHLKNPVAAFRS